MIQKLSAYVTLGIIAVLLVLGQFLPAGFSFGPDDIETETGKILFNVVGVLIVAPIVVHMISMHLHMIWNKKWGWAIATFLFAFITTLAYYFSVYKQQDQLRKS